MNCTVIFFHKKNNGFYAVTKIKTGDDQRDQMEEMNWYCFKVPSWLKTYWDPVEKKFSGGRSAMFRFATRIPHCSNGELMFLPRNTVNRVGNLNYYEWFLQDESRNPAAISKKIFMTPPEEFTPTLDPAHTFDITECCAAQDDCTSCCTMWFQNLRKM